MRITKSTSQETRNAYVDHLLTDRPVIRMGNYVSQTIKTIWKCKTCAHVWKATAGCVVYNKTNCPVCWEERRSQALTRDFVYRHAKETNDKQYFTGKPCKHGHVAPRFTRNRICITCASLRHKRWVKENPTKQRKLNVKHKGLRRLQSAARHKHTTTVTPTWANAQKMQRIYQKADSLTLSTGIIHHVHHIIPLRECKNVCGLHCESNLIIVTQEDHKKLHNDKLLLENLWY